MMCSVADCPQWSLPGSPLCSVHVRIADSIDRQFTAFQSARPTIPTVDPVVAEALTTVIAALEYAECHHEFLRWAARSAGLYLEGRYTDALKWAKDVLEDREVPMEDLDG